MERIFVLITLLLVIIAGCINITQPPPALVVTPPAIVAFSASPAEMKAGESATLLWNVTGATSVTIDQGVGKVAAAGTKGVSPTKTTTYTLTATNSAGTTTQLVTLTVAGISIIPGLEKKVVSPITLTETVFDFIDAAPSAKWQTGDVLPFPGSENDNRGFATYKYNVKMEDGTTYPRVLETHPQWIDEGVIWGHYGPMTIPSGSKFVAKVGFLEGAQGTDGVAFIMSFAEWSKMNVFPGQAVPAKYDGKLDTFQTSLEPIAGKTGEILLGVRSAGSPYHNWASWVDAKIIR